MPRHPREHGMLHSLEVAGGGQPTFIKLLEDALYTRRKSRRSMHASCAKRLRNGSCVLQSTGRHQAAQKRRGADGKGESVKAVLCRAHASAEKPNKATVT